MLRVLVREDWKDLLYEYYVPVIPVPVAGYEHTERVVRIHYAEEKGPNISPPLSHTRISYTDPKHGWTPHEPNTQQGIADSFSAKFSLTI